MSRPRPHPGPAPRRRSANGARTGPRHAGRDPPARRRRPAGRGPGGVRAAARARPADADALSLLGVDSPGRRAHGRRVRGVPQGAVPRPRPPRGDGAHDACASAAGTRPAPPPSAAGSPGWPPRRAHETPAPERHRPGRAVLEPHRRPRRPLVPGVAGVHALPQLPGVRGGRAAVPRRPVAGRATWTSGPPGWPPATTPARATSRACSCSASATSGWRCRSAVLVEVTRPRAPHRIPHRGGLLAGHGEHPRRAAPVRPPRPAPRHRDRRPTPTRSCGGWW